MSQRIGVVRFPGTNCEFDTIDAIRALDGEAEVLWHGQSDLKNVDAIVSTPTTYHRFPFLNCVVGAAAAPADEGTQPGTTAQGGAAAQTPHRDGAARPMPGNGNKRQRPNPRPDLKRGREAEDRAVRRAARPSHTEMNTRSKRRLEALSRRYPGKLELRAPQGATPVTLRMQALTAARFDDILAHVSFAGTGGKDSRLYSVWDQTQIWDPGD